MVHISEHDYRGDRYNPDESSSQTYEIRGMKCQVVFDEELQRRVTRVGPCTPEQSRILSTLSKRTEQPGEQEGLIIRYLTVHDVIIIQDQIYYITECIPVENAQTHWDSLNKRQQQVIDTLITNIQTLIMRYHEYKHFLQQVSDSEHIHLALDHQGRVDQVIILPF